jgi:hypothetical protein
VPFNAKTGLYIPDIKGLGDQGTVLANKIAKSIAEKTDIKTTRKKIDNLNAFYLQTEAVAASGTKQATLMILWNIYRNDSAPVTAFQTEIPLANHAVEQKNVKDLIDDKILGFIENDLVQVMAQISALNKTTTLQSQIFVADSNNLQLSKELNDLCIQSDKVVGKVADSEIALKQSMQNAIISQGLQTQECKTQYSINAQVKKQQITKSQEEVFIDWIVYDKNKQPLGKIEQSNVFKVGALKQWGQYADDAAQNALQGILAIIQEVEKK